MREILFRGKRLDNGKWVEGNLNFFMDEFNPNNCVYDITPIYADDILRVVDPETVGQYTGLKDKNGKRIFEGDIIKDDWGRVYGIFYSLDSCSFMANCPHPENEWLTGNYHIGDAWCDTIRVIGNIHDNQELLKED